jgi:hypothetical protein
VARGKRLVALVGQKKGGRDSRAPRVGTPPKVEVERMAGRTRDASPAKVGDGLIMTVSDLDILRSAHLHLDRYGDQAVAKARETVRTLKERGDNDGVDTWLRIIDDRDRISRTKRPKAPIADPSSPRWKTP